MQVKLTSQQWNVLSLRMEGLSRKEIATRIHVAERTVAFHNTNILKAFDETSMQRVTQRFGHFETKITWVPNPEAPRVIIDEQVQ